MLCFDGHTRMISWSGVSVNGVCCLWCLDLRLSVRQEAVLQLVGEGQAQTYNWHWQVWGGVGFTTLHVLGVFHSGRDTRTPSWGSHYLAFFLLSCPYTILCVFGFGLQWVLGVSGFLCTYRMRYLKTLPRRAKNQFREGTVAVSQRKRSKTQK